jgi:SAM-dependent methyltransferase
MDEYIDTNRKHWDEVVPVHEGSAFYRVEDFKRGEIMLDALEQREVGDVAGKSLLHLQCHFGLDTLSWSRLGATVTGVDFAPTAIETARRLSDETGVLGRFVESDVYALPSKLDEEFDIVFTSYGAIIWLPDIQRWAEVAARYVRPGGFFYMAEFHPFAHAFNNDPGVTGLALKYPYFEHTEPLTFNDEGTYADLEAKLEHTKSHEWAHPLGAIVTALANTGLRIEYVHEFPFCIYQMFPFMVRGDDGYWRLPEHAASLPLTFSLKAIRPS